MILAQRGNSFSHGLCGFSSISRRGNMPQGLTKIETEQASRMRASPAGSPGELGMAGKAACPGSMRPNHGSIGLLGQDLEQHGMGHAAVDDVNRVHTASRRLQGALNFGQHAA